MTTELAAEGFSLELRQRLGKLIAMLGSDSDGEVLNTARAIRKTLDANGMDLNALAERVLGEPLFGDAGKSSGLRVMTKMLLDTMIVACKAGSWALPGKDRLILSEIEGRFTRDPEAITAADFERIYSIWFAVRVHTGRC